MRTINVTLYEYDELPTDRAKERAREWFRRAGGGDDYCSEYVIDDAKTCFALCGFDITDVYYSGFWSQGDGACFVGSWSAKDVKADKLKEHAPQDKELHRIADALAALAKQFPGMSLSLTHRNHYYHEYTVSVSAEFGSDDPIELLSYSSPEYNDRAELLLKAEENATELARAAMRWTYRRLRDEYEYQNADEQVIESIRANAYEFTEDGERA